MARYMQLANEASKLVKELVDLVPEENRAQAAAQALYLYNLGIRTSPRPCQSTVRINAVREAGTLINAKVSAEDKQGLGGRTYKAIRIDVQGIKIDESGSDEE